MCKRYTHTRERNPNITLKMFVKSQRKRTKEERKFLFLKKLKIELSYDQKVEYISEENKNINLKGYMHMYPTVHSSIIYKSQDMEGT